MVYNTQDLRFQEPKNYCSPNAMIIITIMAMVDVDSSSQFLAVSEPKSVGLI